MQVLGFNRERPVFADAPEQPYGLQPAGTVLSPASTVLFPGGAVKPPQPPPSTTAANISAGLAGGTAAFQALASTITGAVAAGRQDEIARLQIQSQERIATLMAQQQAAAAAASRASNTAQADAARDQADQAMAQMRDMQALMAQMAAAQRLPATPPPPQQQIQMPQMPQMPIQMPIQMPQMPQAPAAGGVTTMQLAIGVGVLALVGGGIFFATRSRSNPESSSSIDDESSSLEDDCYDLNPHMPEDDFRGNPFRMGSDGVRRWTTTGRSVKLPKGRKSRKSRKSLRRR